MLSKTKKPLDAEFADSNIQRLKDRVLKEGLVALKCSGKLVDSPVIRSAADLKKSGRVKNLFIVPGAQAQITAAMEKCHLKPRFIRGCRVTDDRVMYIAHRELGKITSGIISSLNGCGLKADCSVFGTFYGKPLSSGNRTGVITRMESGDAAFGLLLRKVMVLAPLGEDSDDDAGDDAHLSFNADTAAAWAAVELGATQLIIAMDKGGIERRGKVLRNVTVPELAGFMNDGTFTDGMIVKAEACIYAAKAGIPTFLVDGNDPEALERVLSGKQCGTAVLPVSGDGV